MSGRIIPDILTKEKIKARFKGGVIGKDIIFYEAATSTSEKAMEMGSRRKGERLEGTVIVADAQTRGKGRFGREWISPPGSNLYFTVLLEPCFPAAETPIITLMAAVAVVSAIREHTGLDASIKWPNDVLVDGKKAGGILTDMRSDSKGIDFVAVGIGINVNMPLNVLPEELRPVTTSLKAEKGETIDRAELLGDILYKLDLWYQRLLTGEKKALLDEWLSLNSTIGNRVQVKTEDRIISGLAQGIGDDGELIVRLSSGDVEKFCSGEVTIIRNNK
ncbi:MAG TPA: biotin--[acetyl-CoA-carboxylase] ligase [Nitrospirae bacterium]|nr:bifunctional ligase/repressor BirA [bacterium BMS3Abin10]GBE39661.1 bifunctional ligase/repressor BirA [bacterium BMS3Bbin08]HDK17533.1 biotin--[acetyl-CoA-carboxylase] ligase [Nitrospirota bacterium]HDK82072.1 biotin--[acetyl-CoA-carboxylase] ligase [Nitrospirota bacterium]HDO26044.1 biotin--[acetyl-CoA-carboxylase] ligase [Nitrospirota bacterium]